jgi:hypothetical protein
LIIPAGDRKMKEGAHTPTQERPETKSQKPQDNPVRAEASAAEEEE